MASILHVVSNHVFDYSELLIYIYPQHKDWKDRNSDYTTHVDNVCVQYQIFYETGKTKRDYFFYIYIKNKSEFSE